MIVRLTLLLLAVMWSGMAFATDRKGAEIALAQAETSVQSAERGDAATAAPTELRSALDNLVAARGAFERRNWTDSAMNSERAQADADLAVARSRQFRAESATAQIEASVQTLRRELGRPGA